MCVCVCVCVCVCIYIYVCVNKYMGNVAHGWWMVATTVLPEAAISDSIVTTPAVYEEGIYVETDIDR